MRRRPRGNHGCVTGNLEVGASAVPACSRVGKELIGQNVITCTSNLLSQGTSLHYRFASWLNVYGSPLFDIVPVETAATIGRASCDTGVRPMQTLSISPWQYRESFLAAVVCPTMDPILKKRTHVEALDHNVFVRPGSHSMTGQYDRPITPQKGHRITCNDFIATRSKFQDEIQGPPSSPCGGPFGKLRLGDVWRFLELLRVGTFDRIRDDFLALPDDKDMEFNRALYLLVGVNCAYAGCPQDVETL